MKFFCRAFALFMSSCLLLAVAGAASAKEVDLTRPDVLRDLPKPEHVLPSRVAAVIEGLKPMPATGILFAPGRVVLEGFCIMDQGPADGLEVLACLEGGKTHEAVVRLSATNGMLVNAAFIAAALGVTPGAPSLETSGMPVRGMPLRVLAQWRPPDKPDWVSVDASCLIRDRMVDQPYPPLPFIYTGSRMMTLQETGPDGKPMQRERFMLDSTKTVIANYDEPDALLGSPFPGADIDQRFEVNSAIAPPPGTPMRLVFEKAELALTLSMNADGALSEPSQPGQALDDAALTQLLVAHYGAAAKATLRALAVVVAANTPRTKDLAARTRIIALAAAAKLWVVPVFAL